MSIKEYREIDYFEAKCPIDETHEVTIFRGIGDPAHYIIRCIDCNKLFMEVTNDR